MSTLTEIVEGWTGALPFTLKADGTAINLTGLTVAIVLKDCHDYVVKNSTSGISVTGSTSGQVEYAPSSSDFAANRSAYRVRFKVTDSTGRIVYFPNGAANLIQVRSL
jgi:hypothetical protein